MTRSQYTKHPAGNSYCNAFPSSTAYAGPTDCYRKASQVLSEQHQQCSLPVPCLTPTAGLSAACHFAPADISSALALECQCTMINPVVTKDALTSTKFCSRQALKKITAELLPAKAKQPKGGSSALKVHGALTREIAFESTPSVCLETYTELLEPLWPQRPSQV